MTTEIHFEQLMEEAWAQYPQSQHICGTEKPLKLWLDGRLLDPSELIEYHKPVFIQAIPARIPADSQTVSRITIRSLPLAGQELNLTIRQGQMSRSQVVTLDSDGSAELEICTAQTGFITVAVNGIASRVAIEALTPPEYAS